jgi:AraC family transcriptional regulator
MIPFMTLPSLPVGLLNAAKCQLDSSWNYCDVQSPFSRLYLITEGEGFIFPNNQKTRLEPGFLYLVPSYVTCSYICPGSLFQYYLHFTSEHCEGLNIYDLYPVIYKTESLPGDVNLFERLLEINPRIELRVSDPLQYQQKSWLNKSASYDSMSQYMETTGIIFQLFSRFFITGEVTNKIPAESKSRFKHILEFIQQNLENEITIRELACKAYLSSDHFTRIFKKLIGQTPLDYINLKRVEKAQLLLATTNLSLKEILEKTGFNSPSYFNRIFKKLTDCTPLGYRKKQFNLF